MIIVTAFSVMGLAALSLESLGFASAFFGIAALVLRFA